MLLTQSFALEFTESYLLLDCEEQNTERALAGMDGTVLSRYALTVRLSHDFWERSSAAEVARRFLVKLCLSVQNPLQALKNTRILRSKLQKVFLKSRRW
jgi:hypothetical protein